MGSNPTHHQQPAQAKTDTKRVSSFDPRPFAPERPSRAPAKPVTLKSGEAARRVPYTIFPPAPAPPRQPVRRQMVRPALQEKGVQIAPAAASWIVQRAEVEPDYAGDEYATEVSFTVRRGDTFDAGSAPQADNVQGWSTLGPLGLTGGADNLHRWLRFHILNERAGGSGTEVANLTPTTSMANQIPGWKALEKQLKLYIDYGSPVVVDKAVFKANVQYHDSSEAHWLSTDGTKEADTEASDYPDQIDASLDVTWAGTGGFPKHHEAAIGYDDGLIKPEQLETVAGWTPYSDEEHTKPIVGDVK
jgi:hypothetical protein